MQGLHEMLFKLGLRTYFDSVQLELTGEEQQKFNGELQTDIGFIYGMSIYADTVWQDNTPLITTTDAENLYLGLKNGKVYSVQFMRLDDLLQVFAGVPIIRPQPYTPVNVYHEDFNLKSSFIQNPTGIKDVNVIINMWYVGAKELQELEGRGIVMAIDKHGKTHPAFGEYKHEHAVHTTSNK
jgi:hypothetical protein